jgi:putative peptide zinc metalloprotease protein
MKNSASGSANSPLTAADGDSSAELIASAFAGGDLSHRDLEFLSAGARDRHVPAGAAIANEGDPGACFVVRRGHLTLTQELGGVQRVVGTAAPGDVIGGDAFATATTQPLAVTIAAAGDADVLELDAAAFRAVVATSPGLTRLLSEHAERALLERLVRATTSFDGVSSDALRGLVQTIERRRAAAGEAIIVQGDEASEAFVIVDGSVDVIDESTQRTLATLGKGALFGETALLNEDHRNATVRAHDDTALLVLRREPFMSVVRSNAVAKARMIDLLNSRERPLRATGIQETRQVAADGSPIAVLKNPVKHTFFRLSGDSLFLWELADGTHTIRDLATALFTERRHFAPQVVIDTVHHLRSGGFLYSTSAFAETADETAATSPLDRVLGAARRALTATAHFHDVDAAFGTMYRTVGRPLFSWPAAIVIALMTIAGMVLFAWSTPKAVAILWTPHGIVSFTLFLLPAYFVLIVLHEIGHGVGVKAVGRTVASVGVGWYWFGPIAFVDTSDSWAASRRQRVLVSAAGLATNLVLASIASAIAYTAPFPLVAVAAWQFALTAYIGVVENLNPLLEYDGYYILVDLLDRPNLRRQSLQWLGSHVRRLLREPRLVRGHGIEFAYGVGAFCYIAFAAGQSLLFYHYVGEQRLAHIIPAAIAATIAWVVPIVFAAVALAALLGEMRKAGDAPAR